MKFSVYKNLIRNVKQAIMQMNAIIIKGMCILTNSCAVNCIINDVMIKHMLLVYVAENK